MIIILARNVREAEAYALSLGLIKSAWRYAYTPQHLWGLIRAEIHLAPGYRLNVNWHYIRDELILRAAVHPGVKIVGGPL